MLSQCKYLGLPPFITSQRGLLWLLVLSADIAWRKFALCLDILCHQRQIADTLLQ